MSGAGRGSPREWDARTYHRLDAPQQSWGRAVLDTIELRGDERVMDAGCGTGHLAAEIARRLPTGRVVGVDRSANMLRVARDELAGRRGSVWLVQADLTALPATDAFDVIFSAATFHWVLDHEALFRELLRALRPGGRLVAQCGGGPNIERILDRADRLLAERPYRSHLAGWQGPWLFADVGTTAERLERAGFVDVDTSLRAAPTVLSDRAEYVEFLRTIVLRAHCDRLPGPLEASFLKAMGDGGAADDPPYSLDYWRLDLRGRRPDRDTRPTAPPAVA